MYIEFNFKVKLTGGGKTESHHEILVKRKATCCVITKIYDNMGMAVCDRVTPIADKLVHKIRRNFL